MAATASRPRCRSAAPAPSILPCSTAASSRPTCFRMRCCMLDRRAMASAADLVLDVASSPPAAKTQAESSVRRSVT